MNSKTCNHQWIMLTQTPVSVIANEEGEPVIFIDPDETIEQTVGCNLCEVEINQAYLP